MSSTANLDQLFEETGSGANANDRRVPRDALRCGDFSGHSLRRGFVINAATKKKKIQIENIKRVTARGSNAIVLDYVAAATLDDDPTPVGELGD